MAGGVRCVRDGGGLKGAPDDNVGVSTDADGGRALGVGGEGGGACYDGGAACVSVL